MKHAWDAIRKANKVLGEQPAGRNNFGYIRISEDNIKTELKN
jgi:hypothetical protein